MLRICLLFSALTISLSLFSQKKNPFVSLWYDSVIMYDFEPDTNENSIIDLNGRLSDKIHKMIILDDSIINILNNKLGNRKSFGGGTRDCFSPHLGIVYYYKKSPVAFINICLDCNRIYANIPIVGKKYSQVFRSNASYYLKDDGMNNSFRAFWKKLLMANNFSHIPQ